MKSESWYLIQYKQKVIPLYSNSKKIRKDTKDLAKEKFCITNFKISYIFPDTKKYIETADSWIENIDQDFSDDIDMFAEEKTRSVKEGNIIFMKIEKDEQNE